MDDFTRGNDYPQEPDPDDGPAPSLGPSHLLIALFPDRGVQRAIEAHRKDWIWTKSSRFPPSQRLHLTLHALDDQRDAVLQRLDESLSDIPMRPLDLVLDSSRTWNNDIAVMQTAEHDGLRALHRRISFAVAHAGIATRTPRLTPHITIARKTTGAACPRNPLSIRWPVNNFLLVRSWPSHPARHEVLASYGPGENDGV
ncbi:2'-5' RNA ligase family protein [Variovorax paradoxus]|jgi:2'-5' RNA ligase|uniref:RNA 2',3'-cyclic phosphodiesterase n=1 Tax=Variovorax paradoxus TaxID=34073 RepID=A0A679J692_VARPD|nr:RNA 2',3'-cyclic phosphodiesterase [Variovorax paradoxus]